MLDRTEYIEQSYMFGALKERLPQEIPIQLVLEQVREETLATTRLPLAVDYLLAEVKEVAARGLRTLVTTQSWIGAVPMRSTVTVYPPTRAAR